ncbi:DUF3168 domain-containing protein [Streptomyces sp. V2]|uniref:DUF3168 domain-containing protein n=1 Tax=Streptomyces sp. V2 TaxID=1424099 RepID=UPI000D66BFBB|nr:DUF3168 domain-containing protein [Streptomyces sp. V2]PWG08779.1 DUF3168 domain-containing protein [Streptomyces sp. V2]
MSTPADLAALATRDAVRAALTADSHLTGLVTGVLDWVPENQPYPYIHLGDSFETPANAHDRFGSEVLQTLHIWSRYRGFAQGLQIATLLRQILDHTRLTIDGHRWTWTRFVSMQTLVDPEPPGDLHHLPMTFRIGSETAPTP